jgi:hypothetical protein
MNIILNFAGIGKQFFIVINHNDLNDTMTNCFTLSGSLECTAIDSTAPGLTLKSSGTLKINL